MAVAPPEQTTSFLGIVVPVESRLFLTIVAVHVLIALATVIVGVAAILTKKGRGRHSKFGDIYYWLLCAVFVTATVLSVMRWSHDWHLFLLGSLAFGLATIGKRNASVTPPTRVKVHVSCMGASYIVLLTAFYVDNGRNLPLWKDLPRLAYWAVPAVVGVPIILRVLARHPLTRERRA
jgi:uncharacterized membrane protein